MATGMSARDTKLWAKEMLLDAIDDMIVDTRSCGDQTLDFDEWEALKKERNRVARFLRLDIKEL